MIDVAQVEAATKAFQAEAKHWRRPPYHGGGRPYYAERHETLEQRSFVSREAPPTSFTTHDCASETAREEFILRACMRAALDAVAQRRDAA